MHCTMIEYHYYNHVYDGSHANRDYHPWEASPAEYHMVFSLHTDDPTENMDDALVEFAQTAQDVFECATKQDTSLEGLFLRIMPIRDASGSGATVCLMFKHHYSESVLCSLISEWSAFLDDAMTSKYGDYWLR